MPALVVFISFILVLAVKSLFNLDLFPVLIVYLSVKNSPEATVINAALAGFLEDALYYPGFLYFLSYSIIGGLALYLKKFFSFEDDDLVLVLVLILTPVSILIAALGFKFFTGTEYPALIFTIGKSLIVNVLVVLALNYFFWRNR
ncbi:MAG: hypothetical protein WC624_03325 [Candidatus Margulisiibacteriota bacterium]